MEATVSKSLVDLAKEAWNAKEMRKYYEDLEKDLLNSLKEACGYKDFILNGYVFQKSIREGTLDYKTILKDFKIDITKIDTTPYRKGEVEMWKLSYVNIKD